MLGRLLKIDTGYQEVTAVQDLLEVLLGSEQAGYLLRAKVMQSSDEPSADAELLQVNLKRASGSYTSGSGGGSATVVLGRVADAAHGLAGAERNNTTRALIGTGALDVIEPGVFNVLAGEWEFAATPETMYPIGPSQAVILSLDEAPTDALTLRAFIEIFLIVG
jgi:hypothetical protein